MAKVRPWTIAPFVLLWANGAAAQVRWDLGASAGVMRRFLSGGDVPGASGGFGPLLSLQGHVALLPLLRVGAYLSHDVAPTNGPEPAKQITSAGLRVKFTPPWPRGEWRAWAFLGLGYAGVYAPSYHPKLRPAGAGAPEEVYAPGSGGAFLEVQPCCGRT